MPVDDWQFWVATAMALAAGGMLLRSLRRKKKRRRPVRLTIGGRPPARP